MFVEKKYLNNYYLFNNKKTKSGFAKTFPFFPPFILKMTDVILLTNKETIYT